MILFAKLVLGLFLIKSEHEEILTLEIHSFKPLRYTCGWNN